MSVQDNLLNEKNIVLEQPETETEKNNQMCSFNSDEMEDMCYFRQDEACGDGSIDVCVQLSWQMLAGESPAVVKVGQPLSQ